MADTGERAVELFGHGAAERRWMSGAMGGRDVTAGMHPRRATRAPRGPRGAYATTRHHAA